jgi:general secretion pathway protein C
MISRAIVLLLLLLTAVSLWVAAAPLVARVVGPPTAMASSPGLPVLQSGSEAVDLGPVLDFAPFGLAEGSQPVDLPVGADTPLVLLGITMAQPQDKSRAIISGGDRSTVNFGIGEAIMADVVLTGIYDDHVTVSWGGQDRTIVFEPGAGGDVLAEPAVFQTDPPVDDPLPDQDAADGDAVLGRYRAEIQEDAAGLLARFGLEVTDQGYLLTDAASDAVLQAGLLPGDVINSVNGHPLGDLASDPALFDEVAAIGSANLSVVRDGTTLLMTFPLK